MTLKALSIAALAGCVTFSSQSAGAAEVTVAPVLDTLHDSGEKIPNTESVYPSSVYTLAEVTPADVNNLPANVVKIYDSSNVAHYYQVGFKVSEFGEGDQVKYFKWGNNCLTETSNASEAVITIRYNAGETLNKYIAGENQTIDSVSEIYLGQNMKGVIGGVGKVGNVSSQFVGNNTTITGADDYTYSTIYTGIGGEIDSITSSFVGNQVNIDAAGSKIQGPLVKVLGDGTVNTLNSEFVGNQVVANTGADIHGGLVNVASNGLVGNVTSDFIRNATQSTLGEVRGGAVYTAGTVNIGSSKFLGNTISAGTGASGGALFNAAVSGDRLSISDSVFVDNGIKQGSTSYGGAIYNTGALSITNTSFRDNYAIGADAKGGAIYTKSDMSIFANAGKTTEFSGNYTLNGSTRKDEAIYVENANNTLTLSATDGGTIILNDKINGASGYNVVLSGDSTGTIGLYNGITNANVRVNGTNIDLSDGNYFNYDFLSLASDNTANFSLDVDFAGGRADKFTLGSESRGTIYINDLNFIGSLPTVSKTIQLLTGPDTISIGLSQDLIDKYHKVTINDRGESDEITQTAKWGTTFGAHLYKDTIEEGIRTAVTGAGRENADSLEYYVNKTTEDLGVVPGGDTMMLMNQSNKFASRTFRANNSSDTYTVGANLGKTYGTFNVNGYSSSSKNTLDANGHTLFEVGDGARVNLQYLTINNLADVDGSLMNIEGGTGLLNYVNINGNDNSAAIVNNGSLILDGGSLSNHNIITGGGIKGSGTTTINSGSYWDIGAGGLQNTINNGNLYLQGGILNSEISGTGTVYLDADTIFNSDVNLTSSSGIKLNKAGVNLTTNADHLKAAITQASTAKDDPNSIVTLTGGTLTKSISGYSANNNRYLDISITGDVTVGNDAIMNFGKIEIADGASLTISGNSLKMFCYYSNGSYRFPRTSVNNGILNLTGGTLDYFSVTGTGTINILGDVIFSGRTSSGPISQDTLYIEDDAILHLNGTFGRWSSVSDISNFINDGTLDLNAVTIYPGIDNIVGNGTITVSKSATAYYTSFNQDLEILEGGKLYTQITKINADIENHGELHIDKNFDYTGTTKLTHNIIGDGILYLAGSGQGTNDVINEALIENTIYIENYFKLTSNMDLLKGEIYLRENGWYTTIGSLTITGGTINNNISVSGTHGALRIIVDTDAQVISNALITSTQPSSSLYLRENSSLTISADNLDTNTYLNSGANLKLKTGTWDDKVDGAGTVTILSGNEVQHATTGDSDHAINPAVVVEDGAKFTASASNLAGTVTNNGEIYLSGVLNRKYGGTGTTYIDDTLHVTSGAGFPATFDLNEGHLISDSIATYTFGHTTNNGGLTFNINASSDAHDLFNLGSTSDAVFDIKDVVFGTYTSPTFANSGTHTYQILKGSPSYLTLGETIHKDIDIYDSRRDQLGVNIYTDDPANRYFDDPYNTYHTSGTVDADIELATTNNNHDSVKVTYGDYHSNDYVTRLDLLSDWNKLSTSSVRNFNFRTADDVYTSIQDVGVSTRGALNINGISETTTDADGNTVIKRSVIDLAGHKGFDMSSTSISNTVNLKNVEFKNGSGRVFDAKYVTFGASLSGGTLQGGIENCVFSNNSSDSVMFFGSNALVHQILNSTFSNNNAPYGSAIRNYSGTVSNIIGSTFSGNTATNTGSSYGGGAIFNESGTISNITNSTFEGNTAKNGGAIYNTRTITNITGTIFEGNTANGDGGAIHNYKTIDNITSSTFAGNSSSNQGGAIYNYYGTITNITNSTFEGNTARSYSGAIYNSFGTITNITNSTFEGNKASSIGGGAICNYSSTITNITGSIFEGNSSNQGGAIYNNGSTISNITNSTFEGNKASSNYGGAIYNYGTIGEIVNSTFKDNHSSSTGGAIYNGGTIKISARGSVDEDGNITEGLTEFTGNYAGSKLTDSNNFAIYNYSNSSSKTATITLNADTHGTILMNDKIFGGRSSASYAVPKLILTGDETGTIKLFDTITGLMNISANNTNITTANNKTQSWSLDSGSSLSSDESAKWTIDVDFANNAADTFTVGSGTGTMYLDNLNVMSNTDSYTKVRVLNKSADNTTVLALNGAVVDIRDTLGDTVYNDETYHQDAGYAVASSKVWDRTSGAEKFGIKDQISQCIDEDLDALNLIVSSGKNQVRNFVFRDGSTYTVTQDLDTMYAGTLNIKGVEGSTSTIDADGHKLLYRTTGSQILNLSDVKFTGATTLIYSGMTVNVSGKETILDGQVYSQTTLNSGNLRFNTNTFASSNAPLTINDGTLALNNGSTETYNIYNLTPGNSGKLALDIDLNAKVSDQISVTSSSGVITVSSIDFINGIPENGEFVVQVLKNSSSSSLQLALDESIKHYVFQEYSDVLADDIQIDTDFGHTYYNRLYTGTAHGDLSLATTNKTNDSIKIKVEASWNDNPEIVDSMGDTLYLVNSSNLSTRNFNSSNSSDVYNLSVDLDKTAAGNLNLNGTLGADGNLSTINFKNHKALQLGDDTNLAVNNVRLTGARDLISVDSSNTDIILNNAFINGNILGSQKYDLRIDGTDTTTILGKVTNSDVVFANGGLVIAEKTFADDSVSLIVEEDAYVHLNDGDISNYEFNNITSSNSSKYGLDLDLETRQADMITAEGSGRIVFEKFDIVNRNLSNVDIGEDYTIRILNTSNDSLQLAISETVQMQLAKEYKLGTVHEIIQMDEVQAVANWGDKWKVVEGDYDVYGKLKLATTVTTNDSLHLYELRKELGETSTNLGDTLMLVSILETDSDRRFWTDSATDRYTLTTDIDVVSSGKMTIDGATDGQTVCLQLIWMLIKVSSCLMLRR